jgi:hypothetical protein
MDELRCPHCGAVLAAPDARFCHACGGVINPAEEAAVQPPAEPPPPPAPGGGAGRSRAARRFAPLALGVGGLGLLVAGIVTAAGGGDDHDLSSVLRTSGVLFPATISVPEIPSPSGTMADFTADHTGTVTTTTAATGEGAVTFTETFDDNGHGWPTGQSEDGDVARSLVDGVYRVSLAASEGGVLAYTWTPGFGSLVDFRVEVEAFRHGPGAAACGMGLLAEGGHPRVGLLVDAVNGRFRAVARSSSEASTEELIGWTESPVIERDVANRVSMLFQDGDVWLLINDTAVGRLDAISFDPAQVAVVARGPGGGEAAACDFDDLVVREL